MLSVILCSIARFVTFSLAAQCPWDGIRLHKQCDAVGSRLRIFPDAAEPGKRIMMHEPEDEFDWETECTRAYRDVVKEHADDGIGRRAAINLAFERILELVTDGSMQVPTRSIREAIDATLNKADEQDKRMTDKALRTLAAGQAIFNFEGDQILDMTVVLGDGLRKVYRFVTALDLDRMDDERYRGVNRAQRAYADKWNPVYAAWRPILQRHATLGDAFDAGDLPTGLADSA
ncbi:MAG: hypothetical protein ACRDSH_01410 [Pseudonocardiaceae bacterium]